jgi:hypothetical protein
VSYPNVGAIVVLCLVLLLLLLLVLVLEIPTERDDIVSGAQADGTSRQNRPRNYFWAISREEAARNFFVPA